MSQYSQRTVREPLLGMVTDHLNEGGINCGKTYQVGCEVVALLASYREEERRLFPKVFLAGPYDEDLFRVMSPGSMSILIETFGQDVSPRAVAVASLKKCASLAIEGWCVFVRRTSGGFECGLFRPHVDLYSAGSVELLPSSGLPVAVFRQSADNTVEVVNSRGDRLEVSLSTASPTGTPAETQLSDFVQAACSRISPDLVVRAKPYLIRLLSDCLYMSHGSMLVVVPSGWTIDREVFSDGVMLQHPIRLTYALESVIHSGRAVDAAELRSLESLLRGMVLSDGVTALNDEGSVVGFRLFVRSGSESIGAESESGGARSRAYNVLARSVGRSLMAALFRSQDGRMEVRTHG